MAARVAGNAEPASEWYLHAALFDTRDLPGELTGGDQGGSCRSSRTNDSGDVIRGLLWDPQTAPCRNPLLP